VPLELPQKVGEPAPKKIDPRDRFVNLAVAVEKGVEDLAEMHRADDICGIDEALGALAAGHMPRHAGLVRLPSGLVGEIDVQAAVFQGGQLVLLPQPKEIVDPATKEVRAKSLATLTVPHPSGRAYLVTPIGAAINPDEDPWEADRLGIDSRFGQNSEGFVIGHFSPLDVGRFVITPETIDLDAGLAYGASIG
jgi:hypothetical protein